MSGAWITAVIAVAGYSLVVCVDTDVARDTATPFVLVAVVLWLYINVRGRTNA